MFRVPSFFGLKIKRGCLVAVTLVLLCSRIAGGAFTRANHAATPRHRSFFGVNNQGRSLHDGEVAFQTLDRNGRTHSLTVISPNEREVVVKLIGHSLADEWRAARLNLGELDGRRVRRRLRRRMPAFVVQAAERLRAQHRRVMDDIERFESQSVQKSRVRGDRARIKYHYTRAFNGLAIRASKDVLEWLRRHPEVAYIRPAVKVSKTLAESAPVIGAPELWSRGLTGQGVVVGIIDTGVDYTHPDLGGGFGPTYKVVDGYDFVNNDSDPMDDNGHGTHVAGIVAADGEVRGVAPDVRLVAYKVLGASGDGWDTDIIAAIEKACDPDGDPATDDALDVINLSVSGPGGPDDPLSQAVDKAVEAGILAVVSAGNRGYYGDRTIGSPGCARNALTVGASDDFDRIASFSSRGPTDLTHALKPDLLAPGVGIRSTAPDGGHINASGTSMAAPHVASAAALLLQHDPSLTPGALKSRLMLSAKDLNENLYTQGSGRIDLQAALDLRTTVVPASLSFGLDDPDWPEYEANALLSVTNHSATAREYNACVGEGLPFGLTVSVTPGSFSLPPGATAALTIGIHVDNSVVPDVTEPPYGYLGRIQIANDDEEIRVPFSIVKSTFLKLSFDAPVSVAYVYNAQGRRWALNFPWREATLLLPKGRYHALVQGLEFPAPQAINIWSVLREDVMVQGELRVSRSEARHVLRSNALDVRGDEIYGNPRFSLRTSFGSQWFLTTPYFYRDVEYHVSDVTDTSLFDCVFASWSTPDDYVMWWHSKGVNSSWDLTNKPEEIREARVRFDIEPSSSSDLWSLISVMVEGGQWLSALGKSGFRPPYVRSYYLMGTDDPDALIRGVQFSVGDSYNPDDAQMNLTPMITPRGKRLELSLNGRSDLDGFSVNMPLFMVKPGELTFGLEPHSWFGRFFNEENRIRLRSSLGGKDWLFVGQMMDATVRSEMPYWIQQKDSGVRRGYLSGASHNDMPLEIKVAPGRCRLMIEGPTGAVAGKAAKTTALAVFDTTASDPNTPYISHFNILVDGKPSKAVNSGQRGVVRFRAQDDVELRSVRLYYRNGTNGRWSPLRLTRHGDIFSARLPDYSWFVPLNPWMRLFPARLPQALVSLKLVLRDAEGNSVTNVLAPAYSCAPSRAPNGR